MKFITLILFLVVLFACSSKKPEKKPIVYPNTAPEVTTTNPKDISIVAKEVASEQGSNLVTEVKFTKGKADVTPNNLNKIKQLYQKAMDKGTVAEVQLITWGDKEYPVKDKSDLARNQQNLVNERNDHLEEVIEKLNGDLEVKKISMAERVSAIERLTASEESQVKESLDHQKAAGKKSEAMVIFILEN
jgi:hypothetical protein